MSNNIFDLFETDESKVNEGVEFPIGEAVFICRPNDATNQFYKAELTALTEKYQVQLKTKSLSEEASSDLMLNLFCKTVLIGWKNFKDKEGKEIIYSQKTAFEILKRLPKLHAVLIELLAATSDFNTHKESSDLKN